MKSDICIVGGGMGGMCAAILLAQAGKSVTILERLERIGRKLLLTGSGKCNISNVSMDGSHYLSDDPVKVSSLIASFGREENEKFLESLGISLCEKNGFLYPVTRQAATVLDALRFKLDEAGVNIVTDAYVTGMEKKDTGFVLSCADGRSYIADKCILACGGAAGIYGEDRVNGYELVKNTGHKVIKVSPALVQLMPEEELRAVAGIRCDAKISLICGGEIKAEDTGELQITEKTFSGIPIFQLSRYVRNVKDTGLKIDFLPFVNDEDKIRNRYREYKDRELERFYAGWLNKKLALFLIKRSGLKAQLKASDLGEDDIVRLTYEFKEEVFELRATGGFRNAQVVSGGVPLAEVSRDLESRLIPGLFIIGEMLNVCGECGGYNLHFAMAGAAACAERILCTE